MFLSPGQNQTWFNPWGFLFWNEVRGTGFGSAELTEFQRAEVWKRVAAWEEVTTSHKTSVFWVVTFRFRVRWALKWGCCSSSSRWWRIHDINKDSQFKIMSYLLNTHSSRSSFTWSRCGHQGQWFCWIRIWMYLKCNLLLTHIVKYSSASYLTIKSCFHAASLLSAHPNSSASIVVELQNRKL